MSSAIQVVPSIGQTVLGGTAACTLYVSAAGTLAQADGNQTTALGIPTFIQPTDGVSDILRILKPDTSNLARVIIDGSWIFGGGFLVIDVSLMQLTFSGGNGIVFSSAGSIAGLSVVSTDGLNQLTIKDSSGVSICTFDDTGVGTSFFSGLNFNTPAGFAVVTGTGGNLDNSGTTALELGYVSGVTSAIQTQINAKLTNPMGAVGDTIYGGAAGAPTNLAANTTSTKKFLTETGTGSAGQAPGWNTIVGADLPNPAAATLGGTKSLAVVSHKWINTISTAGLPAATQPTTDDILAATGASNASAGYVGEFVSSAIATGSAVTLTTATTANVTSISLTAGDWDVEGNVNLTAAAATFTALNAGITSTTATLPSDGTECYSAVIGTVLSDTDTITIPRKRFSLSGTTTVYLVAQATFSAGTMKAFGSISARRVR